MPSHMKALTRKHVWRVLRGVCLPALASILMLVDLANHASAQSDKVSRDLSGHLVRHNLIALDARAVNKQVRETGRLTLKSGDTTFDLELTPRDLRGPGYRAEEIGVDGVARAIDPGPVRTFKGKVRGVKGGVARFTVDDDGIEGVIITPEGRQFVERASKYSEAAAATDYVIYNEADVVQSDAGGCGVTLAEQVNDKAEALSTSSPVESPDGVSTLSVGEEAARNQGGDGGRQRVRGGAGRGGGGRPRDPQHPEPGRGALRGATWAHY
jgi:hypothetical protein